MTLLSCFGFFHDNSKKGHMILKYIGSLIGKASLGGRYLYGKTDAERDE